MASSSFNNRHWPSMFRSKHAAEPWQTTTTQPDMSSSPPSLLSAGGGSSTTTGRCLKHPVSGFAGGVERTPDPRPRWNPRPEQIRILEAIFNSGMINPPRDEIPRIRMRLQEYGHVGDANVFYWFQNRKSRSKHKLRAAAAASGAAGRLGLGLARAPPALGRAGPVTLAPPPQQALIQHHPLFVHQLLAASASSPAQQHQQGPTSSSSSSSDRSSGSSKPAEQAAMSVTEAMDLLGPLAAACPGQMYYQGRHPVAAPPPHKVQVQDLVAASSSSDEPPVFQQWPQGCCLSAAEVATIIGGQYNMHVPVQQQQLPAGAFLGLQCNEVAEPTVVAGHRPCAWGPAASGLGGQFWPGGIIGGDHNHQVGKNNTTVAREVAHEVDATKLGLLQYGGFGSSAAMEAAPLAASSAAGDAVTVASVAASTTTAGLTAGLPASTNGVVANYDLMQGLTTVPGAGTVDVSTGGAPSAVSVAAAPTAAQHEEGGGVVALCITDSVTGKSVAVHGVAAARLDVRAQFGEAAVLLIRGVGERGGLDLEPVPVDASGCTVQPLQHGAFYYVLV